MIIMEEFDEKPVEERVVEPVEEFDFLPNRMIEVNVQNKIILTILKFLPLEDIKSCKLVKKRWYSLYDHDSIFNKRKLVFRGNVCRVEEVNQFLTNLIPIRLTVEFITMNLKEIDFENFGWKIGNLTIMNCLVPNEEALKNMFVNTPNIICLKIYRLDETGYLDKIFTNVLKAFAREETFCNNNLESIYADMTINQNIHIKIFPSLKTFTWDPSIPFTGHFHHQIQNRVEEIQDLHVDLDFLGHTPLDIASAPNLKTWVGEMKFTPLTNKIWVVDMYSKLFSAFSSLEKLILKVTFFAYSYKKDQQELTKWAAKLLLITVIRTCGELRSLHLNMVEWCSPQQTYRSVPVIYLDRMESRELCKIIYGLESFTVIGIHCDRTSFRNKLYEMNGVPKLKFLQLDGFPSSTDTDLRRMAIEFYPTIECLTIVVDLRTESRKFKPMILALQGILDSMKSLRTLTIYFHSPTGSFLNAHRLYGLVLNHEKLEQFELQFSGIYEYAFFDAYYCNKFSFPNLSTFHINYSQPYCSNLSSNAIIEVFEKIKFQLFKMINTMPDGLTNIKLPNGRFFLMHVADVLKICESKLNLRQLELSTLDHFTSPILKHIFVVLCPKLSRAIVHTYCAPTDSAKCRTVQYYYSRRQKALFESELKKINGVYRPSTFRLI